MSIDTQVQYWMAFLALAIAAGALLAIDAAIKWARRRFDNSVIPYATRVGGEFAQVEHHNTGA